MTTRRPRKPRKTRRNSEDLSELPDLLPSTEAALEKAAGVRDPNRKVKTQKSSAIRGGKAYKRSTTSLIERTASSKGTFFVQEDPPRMSKDHTEYCGNPIDGSAYYLAIPTATRALSFWLPTAGRREGESIDAYAQRVKQQTGAQSFRARSVGGMDQITRIRKEQGFSGGKLVERGSGIGQRVMGKGLPGKVQIPKGHEVERARELAGGAFTLDTDVLLGVAGNSTPRPNATGLVDPDPETIHRQSLYVVEFTGGKKSWPKEKLAKFFQPFATKRITITEPGTIESTLVDALDVSPQYARLLVLSGAVTIEHKVRGQFLQKIVTKPDSPALLGFNLVVNFAGKENSPYFSWVTTGLPIARAGQARPDFTCLSAEDRKFLEDIRSARKALGELGNQLNGIRDFANYKAEGAELFGEGEATTLGSLGRTIARFTNWWLGILGGEHGGPEMVQLINESFINYVQDYAGNQFETAVAETISHALAIGLIREHNGRYLTGIYKEEGGQDQILLLKERAEGHFGRWASLFYFLDNLREGKLQIPFLSFFGERFEAQRLEQIFLGTDDPELPASAGDNDFWRGVDNALALKKQQTKSLAQNDEFQAAMGIVLSLKELVRVRARIPESPDLQAMLWRQTQYAMRLWLYYYMGGVSFTGPLYQRIPGSLPSIVAKFDQIIIEITGEFVEQGKVTIFKTYNPVLYEITRLYWRNSDQTWKGFEDRPELIAQVDAAGRYGAALEALQTAVLTSRSSEEAELKLEQRAGEAAGILASSESGVPEELTKAARGHGQWKLLVSLWPVGTTWKTAVRELQRMVADPTGFIADLKIEYSKAVQKAGTYSPKGLPSRLSKGRPVLETVSKEGLIDVTRPAGHPRTRIALERTANALERVTGRTGLVDDRRKFEAAIKEFQAAQGLESHGFLDEMTVSELLEADRVRPKDNTIFWGESEFETGPAGEGLNQASSVYQMRQASGKFRRDLAAVQASLRHIRNLRTHTRQE